MRAFKAVLFYAALWLFCSESHAQSYETDIRNFVEPNFICPISWPPANNPSRAATLPPDIPDGALITRVRMTNNNLWGNNTATWTLSYDRGGKWAKVANYPAQQYGSFYQLSGLVYLNSPNRTADSGKFDPPIVYHTGDMFHVDLVCSGGSMAQPTWEVEFSIPTGTGYQYTYAYGPSTVGGDNGTNTSLSLRVLTNPIGGSWSQARVTWLGGSVTGMACDHVSVGIQSSGANTTATPTEFLYNGSSGFNSISSPGTLRTSDWTNFAISNGQTLVVVCDGTATANAPAWVNTQTSGYLNGGSAGSYYKIGMSYNLSTVSGFTSTPNTTYGLFSVEVR